MTYIGTDERPSPTAVSGPVGATDGHLAVFDGTTGTKIKDGGAPGSAYTDEQAQDAIGAMLVDTATIDFTYTDATPELKADVKPASITEALQVLADNTTQDVSITKHGYAPKAPNDAAKFLNGANPPAYTVPGGTGLTALTGDVTASGSGSQAATIANTAATPGTFGSATKSAVFTVNAKGQITGSSEVTIAGAGGGGSGTLLDLQPTQSVISNVNTEQTLWTYTVPANTLGTTKAIRVVFLGQWLNNVGSNQTARLKVKFGATTLWDSITPITGTNANTFPWRMEFLLANRGATNSQIMAGIIQIGAIGGAPTTGLGLLATPSGATSDFIARLSGTGALDTTSSQALVFTVILQTASTNLTISRELVTVELLAP